MARAPGRRDRGQAVDPAPRLLGPRLFGRLCDRGKCVRREDRDAGRHLLRRRRVDPLPDRQHRWTGARTISPPASCSTTPTPRAPAAAAKASPSSGFSKASKRDWIGVLKSGEGRLRCAFCFSCRRCCSQPRLLRRRSSFASRRSGSGRTRTCAAVPPESTDAADSCPPTSRYQAMQKNSRTDPQKLNQLPAADHYKAAISNDRRLRGADHRLRYNHSRRATVV